jgi:hypothetical protein
MLQSSREVERGRKMPQVRKLSLDEVQQIENKGKGLRKVSL